MPKLDVGVGDEFPAKEVREEVREEVRDGETVVVHHHHHYYRRRWRRPGGWIRLFLWIFLISTLFRLLGYLTGDHWGWGGYWGPAWFGPWGPLVGPVLSPFMPLAGMATSILIVGGVLWFLRERDRERGEDDDGLR